MIAVVSNLVTSLLSHVSWCALFDNDRSIIIITLLEEWSLSLPLDCAISTDGIRFIATCQLGTLSPVAQNCRAAEPAKANQYASRQDKHCVANKVSLAFIWIHAGGSAGVLTTDPKTERAATIVIVGGVAMKQWVVLTVLIAAATVDADITTHPQ